MDQATGLDRRFRVEGPGPVTEAWAGSLPWMPPGQGPGSRWPWPQSPGRGERCRTGACHSLTGFPARIQRQQRRRQRLAADHRLRLQFHASAPSRSTGTAAPLAGRGQLTGQREPPAAGPASLISLSRPDRSRDCRPPSPRARRTRPRHFAHRGNTHTQVSSDPLQIQAAAGSGPPRPRPVPVQRLRAPRAPLLQRLAPGRRWPAGRHRSGRERHAIFSRQIT